MKSLISTFITTILLWSSAALAEPADDAAQALNRKLSSISSLEADFTQIVMDGKGSTLQELSGTMKVKRPKMFSWMTQPPYPQTVISNGEIIWIYDEDLEQVTVQKLDDRTGNTPALLLSGDPAQLASSFDVSQKAINEQGRVRFALKPKSDEALFDVLTVVFDNQQLVSMDLTDSLGQKTAIDFKNVKTNTPIPDTQFEFEIPQGVDVIKDI